MVNSFRVPAVMYLMNQLGIVLVAVQLRSVSRVRQPRYFCQSYTGDFSLRVKLLQGTWSLSHRTEGLMSLGLVRSAPVNSWRAVVNGRRQCHCDGLLLVAPLCTQPPLPPPLCSGGPFASSHHGLQPRFDRHECEVNTKSSLVVVVVVVVVCVASLTDVDFYQQRQTLEINGRRFCV